MIYGSYLIQGWIALLSAKHEVICSMLHTINTHLSTKPLFIEPYVLLSCLQEGAKGTYHFLAALIYSFH